MTHEMREELLSHYAEKVNEAKYWDHKANEAEAQGAVVEANRCRVLQSKYIEQMAGMLETLDIMGYTMKSKPSYMGFGTEYYIEEKE